MIALGVLGALIMGSAFPIFSIIFGEVLDVLTLPSGEVLASVHPWAAGFIGIGLATGTANFLKVGSGIATIEAVRQLPLEEIWKL